ncbi:MAG: hypothetical protein ACU0DD_05370 [Paracoccus sp. (in: a-proteobacteria)]|uniref:hypothetical protein n=1 Tax=Paracoccus sp. TaxID=267 RepID=UPI0040597FE4
MIDRKNLCARDHIRGTRISPVGARSGRREDALMPFLPGIISMCGNIPSVEICFCLQWFDRVRMSAAAHNRATTEPGTQRNEHHRRLQPHLLAPERGPLADHLEQPRMG